MSERCAGLTRAGARCQRTPTDGDYCSQHADQAETPEENEPSGRGRYYGHVAVFEVKDDGTYRLVAGGTEDAPVQFADAAEADTWIRESAGTSEPRTLQVGRLFVDRRYRVQEVTEVRTVVVEG